MTNTTGIDEPLGHFESLLVDELKTLVQRQAAPIERVHRRPRVLLAAGLAALVAAGAVGAGLSHVFSSSPHKLKLSQKLRSGEHVGPAVASAGQFTIYASDDDVELAFSDGSSNGWNAVARFPARRRVVVRSTGDTPDAVYGRTRVSSAARAEVHYTDGRVQPVRLGVRGFFVVAVPPGENVRGASLVVVDSGGKTVARASVAP